MAVTDLDPTGQAAAELRRRDVSACVMWLRDSSVDDRTVLVRRIMLASVFLQAALAGAVRCAGCGDRGCWRCKR